MIPAAVLVVGAGHAAGEFACALRRNGFAGEILLLGEEAHIPYQRPALSKGFLSGAVAHEQLYVRTAANFEKAGIQIIPNVRVLSIDRAAKSVVLSDRRTLHYSKLVLATGGRPRRLSLADPRAESASNVHYLRTIDHVNELREGFLSGKRLVIVGGGYIGLEVAAVACQKKMHVTLLECLPRVLARVTAPQVSDFYTGVHRAAGVNILVNTQLTGFIFDSSGRVAAVEADGLSLPADLVLVGIGLIPNAELAGEAGLEIDNGIAVDEYGQTSDPDILAIGDCSSYPNRHVGRRVRLESVASTVEQARTAASVLVGKKVAYDSVPWFWSDQYNLKLQIAGLSHGYDSVVFRGSPKTESFLAFYLKGRRLLAVDAVNRVRDFNISKKLVAARIEVDPQYLSDDARPLADLLNAKL